MSNKNFISKLNIVKQFQKDLKEKLDIDSYLEFVEDNSDIEVIISHFDSSLEIVVTTMIGEAISKFFYNTILLTVSWNKGKNKISSFRAA